MRRNVESAPNSSPVDGHERARDYLSEAEFAVLLQGARQSRHQWRNTAMLMLMFYHGLRVTELCRLKRHDVDLQHGRIWVQRLKGSLSTEQPLQAATPTVLWAMRGRTAPNPVHPVRSSGRTPSRGTRGHR